MRILAIGGSRRDAWDDPERIEEFVDEYLDGWIGDMVISGESPGGGVDTWVREACERRAIPFQPYPPDFKTHGVPAAFFVRNRDMARAATDVTAIWNGRSTGTKDLINQALLCRKHLEVIFP